MTVMVDLEPLQAELTAESTLGDALLWVQNHLQETGKVIVKVELDGATLEGQSLTDHNAIPIHDRAVGISTADQRDLAHAMLGKLAALVEFLGTRQHDVAGLIEQGQTAKALEQLGGVLSAWQQIQQAFSSLAHMLRLNLDQLPVGEKSATAALNEFHAQLQEIQSALQNQDMVLLGDILQYEMDAAISNWTGVLAITLGVVDGVI